MIHWDPKETFKFEGPLKPRVYSASIESAEVKPTQAGNGTFLALMLIIIGPFRAGFRLACNILLEHPSEGAMYYSRKLLQSLLEALGVDTSQSSDLDPATLIGQVVAVDVTVKDRGPKYGMKNDVIKFLKADINDVPEETETSEELDHIPF